MENSLKQGVIPHKANTRAFKNLPLWMCAFSGILSMNPYFVWNTVYNGILTYLVYLCYIISIVGMILVNKNTYTKYTMGNFLKMIILYLLYVYIYIIRGNGLGLRTLMGSLVMFIFMCGFILQKPKIRKNIFEKFVVLFIISLIPGIIYYVFEMLGISLNLGTMYSNNQIKGVASTDFINGGYYKVYLGAVMRVSNNTRFSGIYDEAGLVGTVCAILLAARKFEFKKNITNCILLFFGIISFSVSFYILIALIMILKVIRKGMWKTALIVLGIILGAYALLTIKTDSLLINNMQNRFEITSTGISIVNNRTTSHFDKGYDEFLNGDISTKLFGFGYGASSSNPYLIGSSSYKLTMYNYGYFGFAFMIFTILLLYGRLHLHKILRQWNQIVLLIIFLISIYQRPGILYPYYFISLFGGCAFLNSKNNNIIEMEINDDISKKAIKS